MDVKIVVGDAFDIPEYATPGSAGVDLYANNEQSIMLKPGETRLIPTGLKMEIPEGYECQIRPRSGLVLKHGITVLNSPGTVDSDYRGEWGIILHNFGDKNFFVHRGDRIAQAVFCKYERVTFIEVKSLSETVRGAGGYGHTGNNSHKQVTQND